MEKTLDTLEPIRRAGTLGRQVRDQLRSAIMAGHFKPGEKLAIRAVAAALDVSITPAREALYNLASEGTLEMRTNGSVYVHTLTEGRIVELTKIRIALESLASREAARLISEQGIDLVESLNQEIIDSNKSAEYSRLMDLNWQFHFTIYRASKMPQLVRMIEGCWMMTGSYLNIIYPEFGEVDHGIQNHISIVHALRNRDAERLSHGIVTDINFAADALLASIEAKAHG